MDSNPKKPGRFRDILGCQDKTRKVWGAASLLRFEKEVVGGNVSWKDARFVPTPFIRSCRPGVAPFIWQALKSSWDAHPLERQSKERRDVLHEALQPRGCGSLWCRHIHGDLGPGGDLGLQAGHNRWQLGRGGGLGTAHNKLTVR